MGGQLANDSLGEFVARGGLYARLAAMQFDLQPAAG